MLSDGILIQPGSSDILLPVVQFNARDMKLYFKKACDDPGIND